MQEKPASDNRLGEFVAIPAGSFRMGSNPGDPYAGPNEFPQHMVELPAYEIGRNQVTRGQYRLFMEAGGYQNWYLPPESGGVGPGDCDYIGIRMVRGA